MKTIRAEFGRDSYDIYIGAGLLAKVGGWLKERGFSGKVVLITDPTVKRLYGERLAIELTGQGFNVVTLLVPEGEAQKSLQTAARLYQELTNAYIERNTPVLALGGGVIGDLAGFVAATYLRGVPLVQLPTTLLAQVDSSIGGKVAVDHERMKNKIGTFYQPGLVVADTDTLKTLSALDLGNGLAEIIKSAAIRDRVFFDYLEANIDKVKSLDITALEEIVYRTARIKVEIVEKDERESGLRALLNYGHTIGHGIEAVSDFRVAHGQAVAIGMVAAAKISNRMGVLANDETARLTRLIEKAGLPTDIPKLKIDELVLAMQHDKKVQQSKVRFVLLKEIGRAYVTDQVSPSLVRQVMDGTA